MNKIKSIILHYFLLQLLCKQTSSLQFSSYRMDGIERNPDVAASDYVTPYGPSGNEFYRYKLLMDGLIPNSGSTFSNTSLRPQEKVNIYYVY